MKKMMEYIVTICIATTITLCVLTIQETWQHTGQLLIGELSDAFFVSGVMLTCFGLLMWSANHGAFDMLSYGIMKLFDLLKKDLTKVKYRTFYDYREAQKGKKRSFSVSLVVGVCFIVIAFVFVVIYNNYK